MKIRNGFVSNSSSSSFVVILPVNFLESVDYDKISNENESSYHEGEKFPIEDFKKMLERLITNDGLWGEEIYNYDKDDWEFEDILTRLLDPYTIESMDTSSGGGQWVVADRNKVIDILNKTK